MFHINTLKKISNLLVVVLLVQQRNAYAHDLGKSGDDTKPNNHNSTGSFLRGSSTTHQASSHDSRAMKAGNFKISLMHMGTDKSYNHIFEKAARRWERIIVGDLKDVPKKSSSSHSWFGSDFDQKVNVDIDDVLIGYQMEKVDGRGGVLGFAGPVYRRKDQGSITAISGIMKFDKEDFDWMSDADVELVIIHEMGHVLGIGSFWNDRCGTGCASGNTVYTCDKAKAEYKAMGYSDNLKLQSQVGGHWDESNFGGSKDEIMTPFFDQGKYQPISRITTGALSDLGYKVNMDASDHSTARRKRGLQLISDVDEMNAVYEEEDMLVPSYSFIIDEIVMIKPRMIDLD